MAAEYTFIDERGAVGIRLEPATAIAMWLRQSPTRFVSRPLGRWTCSKYRE
jgi:hypothetical protein